MPKHDLDRPANVHAVLTNALRPLAICLAATDPEVGIGRTIFPASRADIEADRALGDMIDGLDAAIEEVDKLHHGNPVKELIDDILRVHSTLLVVRTAIWALYYHPDSTGQPHDYATAPTGRQHGATLRAIRDMVRDIYTSIVDRWDEYDHLDTDYLGVKIGGVPASAVRGVAHV